MLCTRRVSSNVTLRMLTKFVGLIDKYGKIAKGQLISKGLLGVIVSTKKTNEISLRISALASK